MKVLIVAGSLYQTVPEAPIDSSQQQRFFHMSVRKLLKENDLSLPADSGWRKNFEVNGLDPLKAEEKSDLFEAFFFVQMGLAVIALFLALIGALNNYIAMTITALVTMVIAITTAFSWQKKSISYANGALLRSLQSTAKNLPLPMFVIIREDWNDLMIITHQTLVADACHIIQLQSATNDLLDRQVASAKENFRRKFDELKLAKLIPEHTTYHQYFEEAKQYLASKSKEPDRSPQTLRTKWSGSFIWKIWRNNQN